MRVVDDTKMPVPNTTDSRQDIQGSLSTGSQAQEGHGFSAVHLASSELSQALIRHLCVCSVLSTPWYLSFTHSLLFLMVFNSLKFEIDIIWALVIPTIWEGDFQIMGTSIFRHKHLLGVCSNGKNQIHKGLLFQVHFCLLAGVLWRYSVLLGEMILKQWSVNF